MRRALIIAIVLFVASTAALTWGLVFAEAPGTLAVSRNFVVFKERGALVVRPQLTPSFHGIMELSVTVRRRGVLVAIAEEVHRSASSSAWHEVVDYTPAEQAELEGLALLQLVQMVKSGDTALVSMSRPVPPREADVLFRKPGLVPRASGIALVVGAAGLFPMTLYALWFARSYTRRLHGLCGACGYALAGARQCPECGASAGDPRWKRCIPCVER